VWWSTGWARSALFGVTLLGDVSVGMAESTTDMSTLHGKGIDGKRVKRGMKDSKWDDGQKADEIERSHGKERGE
jgi:hypothetical protein